MAAALQLQTEAPRQGLGTFFRALVEFVEHKNLLALVKDRCKPATQRLFDSPPRALSFMPSDAIDDLETALGAVGGEAMLVECGLCTARSMSSVVLPAIRAAFFLFGQSPASIFANLDRFFSLATRGIAFAWGQDGPNRGQVAARFSGSDKPEAAFHVLRGTLLFVYEVCGVAGSVEAPHVLSETPFATTVTYQVHWP